MEAPNDGSVGPGTVKFELDENNRTSIPFRLQYESILSGNRQNNNRIALQLRKVIAGGEIPQVELQARIPSVGGIMAWDGLITQIGGTGGNFWQGETNHALEYRLHMLEEDAAAVCILLQAN